MLEPSHAWQQATAANNISQMLTPHPSQGHTMEFGPPHKARMQGQPKMDEEKKRLGKRERGTPTKIPEDFFQAMPLAAGAMSYPARPTQHEQVSARAQAAAMAVRIFSALAQCSRSAKRAAPRTNRRARAPATSKSGCSGASTCSSSSSGVARHSGQRGGGVEPEAVGLRARAVRGHCRWPTDAAGPLACIVILKATHTLWLRLGNGGSLGSLCDHDHQFGAA